MIISRLFQVAIITMLFTSPSIFAGSSEKPNAPVNVGLAIKMCDSLFAVQRYGEVLQALEDANARYPHSVEILWRLANEMINEGDDASGDAKEKYYRKSVEYAKQAVQADPSNANAHAYLAAAEGCAAVTAGSREEVRLANVIKLELDEALRLDPQNQVAHTIYGTWHRHVADVSWLERQLADILLGGLPKGSIEESISHLQTAIRIAPNVLRHRYELGLTYIAEDRPDLAAKAFREALKCPNAWSTDWKRRKEMQDFLSGNT